MKDSFQKERVILCLNLLVKVLESNSLEFSFSDNLCTMLIKFSKRDKVFRGYFYGHKIVDKVNKWLSSNSVPPTSTLRGQNAMFKNNRHNNKYSYDIINEGETLIKDFNNKRKAELKAMFKKLEEWEDQSLESEDDLFDEELPVGSKVDFNTGNPYHKWASGIVTTNMGEIIGVTKETDEMEVDGKVRDTSEQWIFKDDSELAPYQSKVKSSRAKIFSLYKQAYHV
jgi:hypothetical protein